jgi:hypothetical protein
MVEACIEHSTAYVDCTGEHVWANEIATKFHEKAQARNAVVSILPKYTFFSANILLDNSPVCCGVFSARRHVLHARRLHLQGSTHSNRTDYILHPALLAWIQRWYGCFCFCWPRRLLSLAYECGKCSPRFLRTWCRAASSILYFASACTP